MKILLPTDSFPPNCGGSGWSTYELARGLRARGHEVFVVQPRPGQLRATGREYDGFEVEEVAAPAPPIPYVRNYFKNERLWQQLQDVLSDRIARQSCDIVHAQHVLTTVPAIRAARTRATPVVATVRDYWPVCYWSTLIIDPSRDMLCPACTVKVAHSPVAQWGGLGTLTSSLLRDQNVNYLVPALDAMISIMKPAIYAANAQDRVRVAAYNATLPAMQDLKKGVLMAGLAGNPPEWIGWAAVDQVLRALSGQKPIADELVPNRMFTRANIGSVDLSKPTVDWFGVTHFREGYKKLWGVQ